MQSKILDKKRLPIKSLHEFQGDFKTLGKKQFEKLKKSIEKNGFIQPFFIWNKEGQYYILDGHQRKKAIIDLYGDTIDVDCIEIKADSELEAKKFVIFYSSSYAEFDKDSFFNFADGLSFDDLEAFQFPNFSFSENDFLKGLDSEDDDEIPDVAQNECGVELGDIYKLGEHRLMCGDSTDVENVSQLFNGETPNLMVTDPPYGVQYSPEWRDEYDIGVGKRSKGKVLNDDTVDWSMVWNNFKGNVAYIWHASLHTHEVSQNLIDAGFEIKAVIIWAKQHFPMSRGDYHWQHEPCLYVVRKGKKHNWTGDRKQTTVWEIKNNNAFGGDNEEKVGHGTQKPIECMERPIRNNSNIGECVFDPFGGSGSTLIACEKTKRKCYMMELDPHYCSVIIKRWEKYTGQKAVKCE